MAESWLIRNHLNDAQHESPLQALSGFEEGDAWISYLRILLGT